MIIFRPHRGGLAEAMAEAKEFQAEEEMKQYICKYWGEYCISLGLKNNPFDINDIVIDSETFDDDRCGWHDTRYVCVKRMGKETYDVPKCIGMCAKDYER